MNQEEERSTFVAPYPATRATYGRYTVTPAEPLPMLPTTAQSSTEVSGSFVDRAKGFQIASVPLAAAVGLGSLIVGIVGWGVPFFSVAALAWLWTGFLLTWFGAWVVHNLFSGDGIALLQAMLGYRYLRHEQKARLARWASIHEREIDRE